MATAYLFVLLSLFLVRLASHSSPVGDPKWIKTDCNSKLGMFAPNTPFATNLNTLLHLLPQNMLSTAGYNMTNVGGEKVGVYGRAECRGDIRDARMCQNCVQAAVDRLQVTGNCDICDDENATDCNFKYKSIWFDYCQVVYSSQNISSDREYKGKYTRDWEKELPNVSNPPLFKSFAEQFMKNLSSKAVSKPSGIYFATGESKFSRKETIYGLLQCSRDTRPGDCSSCLARAIEELMSSAEGRPSGVMLSQNCNVRFALKRFYNINDHSNRRNIWIIVAVGIAAVLLIAAPAAVFLCRKRVPPQELPINPVAEIEAPLTTSEGMAWDMIEQATGHFSDVNKLGRGGVGIVYKGTLPDGREIAAKKLLRSSQRDIQDFQNQVFTLTRLQHKHIVKLLGFSVRGEERVLVYEFMPNRSLDYYIFNSDMRLDWRTSCSIIAGIARGMLYLHEESRLRIIHRDLKPSNVLLDANMAACIADFDIARIFCDEDSKKTASLIVGSRGYMAPEYRMRGHHSEKSDVYSFGVVVLEIVSGKRNYPFDETRIAPSLLAYAWKLWNEGRDEEFIEPSLRQIDALPELKRAMRIGLLCVQEAPDTRPTMSQVILFLESEVDSLPRPEPPNCCGRLDSQFSAAELSHSINRVTVTEDWPR